MMDTGVTADAWDDLLRYRFLVGDVSTRERDLVEDACARDGRYFESLCAFEDELLALYLRGELHPEWCARLVATLPAYPKRQRRLQEITELRAVLEDRRSTQIAARPSTASVPPARRPAVLIRALAAAAALVAIVIAGWAVRRSEPVARVDGTTTTPSRPATFVTFALVVGQQRSDLRQANVFPEPRQSDEVHLEVPVPAGEATAVAATLRRVGDQAVPMAAGPARQERRGDAIVTTWRVPAASLVAGDYLLTVTADVSGTSQTVATAFFSVVE
jgi:hypothetical protein